jgi:cytochrome c oxidase assembly protein subunit 15
MTKPESAAPDRRLFGLCLLTLAWSVLVLQAGGFTTSIQAGMAFLDWPLSNGSVNPPGWLTEIDKFAEHSHRLAATGLGLLCVVIAVAHRLRETRAVVRRAAYALFGLVVLQGLLGGLRVLLDQLLSLIHI